MAFLKFLNNSQVYYTQFHPSCKYPVRGMQSRLNSTCVLNSLVELEGPLLDYKLLHGQAKYTEMTKPTNTMKR